MRSLSLKTNRYIERIMHNWPIKIISLVAAILLFSFYRISSMEERFFTVPLNVEINDRLIASEEYPRTVRVTVKGRAEDILLILEDDISISADFRSCTKEGEYTSPVKIVRKGAALSIEPIEILVEPMEITLSLEKKVTRSLEVKPSIIGFPEKGYNISQYFITPSSVEAQGPESVMKGLSFIHSEDIDVSDRKNDFTVRVRLRKPSPSVVFPGGNVVEFTAVVQEAYIVRTMNSLDMIALDLDARFELSGINTDNTLKIQGKELSLKNYTTNDFRFTVDCSGIRREGSYTLKVVPDVPTGVLVLDYDPKEIVVAVKSASLESNSD